jgi:hypothetical protein
MPINLKIYFFIFIYKWNTIKYNKKNNMKYFSILLCFLLFLCVQSKAPLNNNELSKAELDQISEELNLNHNFQANL